MSTRDAIPHLLSSGTVLLTPDPTAVTAPKTFHHVIDIYLKDSNAFMNTYFSRYFEWQGVCRERWFHQSIDNLLSLNGAFATKRAHQEYVQETFPFQRVDCFLNTLEVKQCSTYLVFRFYVDGRPVSMGYQQVVFADTDKRIRRIPGNVRERFMEYELIAPEAVAV